MSAITCDHGDPLPARSLFTPCYGPVRSLFRISREIFKCPWNQGLNACGEQNAKFSPVIFPVSRNWKIAVIHGQPTVPTESRGRRDGLAASKDSAGPDDESLRSRAYKIERVTRDQSKHGVVGAIQHFSLPGIHDLSKIHAIAIESIQCLQRNFIVFVDVAQGPEECVAMSGDPYVAGLARECRTWDVSDGTAQGLVVNAFQNHCCNTESAYLDAAQRRVTSSNDRYRSIRSSIAR
jgi:hypothetical protein